MRFKPALWDGTDPSYAPCLKRGTYWMPPKKYLDAGYAVKCVRVEGTDLQKAQKCRDLTREMLRWHEGTEGPKVQPGTWGWLIAKYKSDDFSPFHEVKDNTKQEYLSIIGRWEGAIADALISNTDHQTIKRWERAMKERFIQRALGENARRAEVNASRKAVIKMKPVSEDPTSYVKRMFTMLRTLASYGVILRANGARDVKEILGEIRLRGPKPRTIAPTPEQIAAVIEKADEAGDSVFALGLHLQWWTALRTVDIRGQWLGSGKARRWADGLTWDMIDKDITTLRKTPSKTERHGTPEMVFDLRMMPEIRARLQAIPVDQRVGPVIALNGVPFRARGYRDRFRKYARLAGVPDDVWLMDTRAGALTHAETLGASIKQIQHAAGHTNPNTTERYIRSREKNVTSVLQLRRTGEKHA